MDFSAGVGAGGGRCRQEVQIGGRGGRWGSEVDVWEVEVGGVEVHVGRGGCGEVGGGALCLAQTAVPMGAAAVA